MYLGRAIVIATVIASGAFVLGNTYGTQRWQLAPAPGGTVYRIDRVSGAVHHCDLQVCRVLPTAVPVPRPQQPHKTAPQDSTT